MLPTIRFTISMILALGLLQGCSAHRYGNYINTWRYWSPMVTLKKDSTFEFVRISNDGIHMDTVIGQNYLEITERNFQRCVDSTYGSYLMDGDTVVFRYATDTLSGRDNCFSYRPERMLWRGKRLYYIYRNGFVLTKKDYYFKWTSGKAPTLREHRFTIH